MLESSFALRQLPFLNQQLFVIFSSSAIPSSVLNYAGQNNRLKIITLFRDAELGHSPEPVGEHGEHGGLHPHAHLGWPSLDPASAMAASHLGYLPVDMHKLSEHQHHLLKHESNVKLEPVDPHAKNENGAPVVTSSSAPVPTPEQYHNWMLQHHAYSNPSMYPHYQAHQNIEVQHPAIGFA